MRIRRRRKRRGLGAAVEGVLHRILAATWFARRVVRGWRIAR
jgi:hypothetical protein